METLRILAWISICVGGLSLIVVYVDINMGRYQAMPIMNLVWPITALYMGPVGVLAYWRYARVNKPKRSPPEGGGGEMSCGAGMDMSGGQADMGGMDMGGMDMGGMDMGGMDMGAMDMGAMGADAKPQHITFKSVFVSATHCGAGCSVADLLSETLIYVLGITIFGAAIWAGFIIDYFVALGFGIIFQYCNIMPMRPDLTPGEGIREAAKADFLSLTSFQVGMYAWMLAVWFVFDGSILANNPIFWWMMQIAMCFGIVTNFPVNYLLIRWGIKTPCA